MMPDNMNRKTFDALRTPGGQNPRRGCLTQQAMDAFGSQENIPRYLLHLRRVLTKIPVLNWYWNSQLKRNNAYEDRFAQPYQESL